MAQIVAVVLVFVLFLVFLLHLDDELVVGVDGDGEVLFAKAGDTELHVVGFVRLGDVEFRGHGVFGGDKVVTEVEKLVEECGHQVLVSSCY